MSIKIPNRIPKLYRTKEITINEETFHIKGFKGMDRPILKKISTIENNAARLKFRIAKLTVLQDEKGNIVYDDVTIRNIDPEGNTTERVVKQGRNRPDGDFTDKEVDAMIALLEEGEELQEAKFPLQKTLAIRGVIRAYNPKIKPSELEALEDEAEDNEEELVDINDGDVKTIYSAMMELGEPLTGFEDFQKTKKNSPSKKT